jgi:hypothetical protein
MLNASITLDSSFSLHFYAYLKRENLSLQQTEGRALLVSLPSTKLCFLDRKQYAE